MVVGNGESRKLLDLEKFSKDYEIVGCNAICRETSVEKLVCVDRRMLEEAVSNENSKNTEIYTREDYVPYYQSIGYTNVFNVPDIPYKVTQKQDEPFHWGSGPYAVLIGALTCRSNVLMVGFDLYSKNGNLNNVYKDTQNYKSSKDKAVDPAYWIYQIGKVFELFPKINFIIFQEEGWKIPNQWQHDNVRVENIN